MPPADPTADLVALVRADVAGRVPVDDRERTSVARVLAELDRLARPFDESSDPVHVTGSALVVGPRGIVLLRHRRLGIWVQPGGHVDGDESPWAAAAREATEETGLSVAPADLGADGRPRLAHVDVHEGGRGHVHLDLRYRFHADDVDPAPPPGESQEVHWFAWPDALAIADPGLTGALRQLAVTDP